jgi:hypothetical protein
MDERRLSFQPAVTGNAYNNSPQDGLCLAIRAGLRPGFIFHYIIASKQKIIISKIHMQVKSQTAKGIATILGSSQTCHSEWIDEQPRTTTVL